MSSAMLEAIERRKQAVRAKAARLNVSDWLTSMAPGALEARARLEELNGIEKIVRDVEALRAEMQG